MKFNPHGYQADGLGLALASPGFLLAWIMGAGKSVTAMTYIEELLFNRMECRRALVVAPKKTCETTWANEPGKWDHLRHLRVALALGPMPQRRAALQAASDVVVINRENFPWLVKHYGKHWPFDLVLWDESSGLKDHSTLRFKALRAVRSMIKRLLLLSGTPAPNSLLELWPQMFLLDGGAALGRTLTSYREAYFEPDKRSRQQVFSWKLRPGAEQEIYARVKPLMMSLDPKDYPSVPERFDIDVPVRLPDRARTAYNRLEAELVCGDITADTAAVLSGKLRQVASGRCYDENGEVVTFHEEKMDALEEILESADSPVLVFYEYKHTHSELVRRFGANGLDVGAWQRGEIPVMALHPASAGHGIDGLQHGGSIVVWVDLPWSLELWQQANARLDRQGQNKPVRVIRLVASDTVDELVVEALGRKAINQDRLLEALKRRSHEARAH